MPAEEDPRQSQRLLQSSEADPAASSEPPAGQTEPDPKLEPSLGSAALDALAAAVGGRNVLLGIGGALLLLLAAAAVGLFPPLFGGGGSQSAGSSITVESGPSLFTPVPPPDLDKAIALLMLADEDKARIRAQVQNGAMRIALITVLDNDAEDGDWVSISGAGFRQDVRLFHKPYTVAVPHLPGQPVLVTGLKDGGGGDITVTVMVGAAKLSLKPLKERETLQLVTP